ncbi:MAG: ATP-binding cassette domain-containing protein, partial [Desulfamplus sp.]|nr:ATP-binding cassette domain-containing protein [Desulfamplus sp.]
RVSEMLELVNLEQYAKRDIKELSGGERQRVALARTLAPSPHLIMLDEPLGALDRRLRERLLADLSMILNKTAITTIWVTHDHNEAFSVADLVCVMSNGVIQQIGSPEDVYHKPVNITVADFLGFQNIIDLGDIPESMGVPENMDVSESMNTLEGMHTLESMSMSCAAGYKILIMPDSASVISEDVACEIEEKRTSLEKSGLGGDTVISGIIKNIFFQGSVRKISITTYMNKVLKQWKSNNFFLPNQNNGHDLMGTTKNESLMITDSSKDFDIKLSRNTCWIKKFGKEEQKQEERQEEREEQQCTLFFDIPGHAPIPEIGKQIFLKIDRSGIKIFNQG